MPLPGAENSAFSVNHGAGRNMSRSEAMRTLDQSKINADYEKEGVLVNTDGMVPLDESSGCYKSSDEVIKAVTAAGLARIEHHLWPLSSIKGTDERGWRKKKGKGKRHTSKHY